MLTESLRERLQRITEALRVVRDELVSGRLTQASVESLDAEIRRLDNTVARATELQADAPELASFHDVRRVVKDLARETALRLGLPAADELPELATMLASVVPLAWNGTSNGVVRWLTKSTLLLGPFAWPVSTIRSAGSVRRLMRDDVLWLELHDGSFVSFLLEDRDLAALIRALSAAGVSIDADPRRAERASVELVSLFTRHIGALESFCRNFGLKPDVSVLMEAFPALTVARLVELSSQNAMARTALEDLRPALADATAKAQKLCKDVLRPVQESTSGDFPELYTRLEPHLPLVMPSPGVVVSRRVLIVGTRQWVLSELESIEFKQFGSGATLVTATSREVLTSDIVLNDNLVGALKRAGVEVRVLL